MLRKERLLLERAVALLQEHPELQSEGDAKLRAFFRTSNKTLGEVPDPRSESSRNLFLEATANDPALREFLNTTSCNYNIRFQKISESASKQRKMLNGRVVICPTCGDGPVIIRDSYRP